MRRKPATIICDAARSWASSSAPSPASDRHDVSDHHRYYGSSATNGGERIVESRRGPRPRFVNAVSEPSLFARKTPSMTAVVAGRF